MPAATFRNGAGFQFDCQDEVRSVFYEGEHNDARTNVCIALTAAMYGSCIANYAKAQLLTVRDAHAFHGLPCHCRQVERIVFDEKGVATGAEDGRLPAHEVSRPCDLV